MKVPKGNPYHSATSGEMAIYRANSRILQKVNEVFLHLPLETLDLSQKYL